MVDSTEPSRHIHLSRREKQVLAAMASDLPMKRIALELGISRHTVSRYVCQLKNKIGADTIAGMIYKAGRSGLIAY